MRVKLFAAVTAFLAAMIGLPATAASAATPCPSGTVCLYADANYGGRMIYYTVSLGGGIPNLAHDISFNDTASSIINNSNGVVRFWTDASYKGYYFEIGTLKWNSNLVNNGFNDLISSFEVRAIGG
ncbi:peptidase inhibitor family I36 protein [Actinoplanes sp. NPDC051494]|uniref:peptidase inhibitor family I36 protein n=1 Tax=Actinoplanes sp. NPDC051494 TaxID=3363907 RepID=UPI003798442B